MTMKRYFYYILAVCLLPVIASCENDDSDLSAIINDWVEPITIAVDSTALSEQADVPVTDVDDPAYNDYVENTNFNRSIFVHYDGETVAVTGSVSGVRVTVDGAHVTVNSSTTRCHYVLSGEADDGSFKVYSEHKFRITLSGLTLTNTTGAAINIQSGKTTYVVLAPDTDNSLTDGPTYSDVADEDCKGTFFSEGQLIFSGSGSLNVSSVGRHGLVSDDYMRFRPGVRLYVHSTSGHGIKSNDGVFIDGGVINVETTAAGSKALKCDSVVTVNGGRTTLITRGDCTIQTLAGVTDTTSCAALKCDYAFSMTAGTMRLYSSGDGGKGLNCLTDIAVAGGTLQAVTEGTRNEGSPKGIKSSGNTTITGGTVYSYSKRSVPLEVLGTFKLATGYTSLDETHRQLYHVVY